MGTETKVWLACGHCGHTFQCKAETIAERQRKGKWLPYCGTPCTTAALQSATGAPPTGSRYAADADHAAKPATIRARRERPVLQRPEDARPDAHPVEPVSFFRRASLPRDVFGPGFTYEDYLQLPRWRALAEAVKEAAGHCEVCGSAGRLEAHHTHYETLGRETPDDLLALCRPCHRRWHEILHAGSGSLGTKEGQGDVMLDVAAGIIRLVRRRPRGAVGGRDG